jgi:hypothetical protein
MFTLIKNEKGVVLVISLMILALLSVLSLTAILTTTTDLEISTNYRVLQTTFYNTEGSMDIAPGPIRRTISLKTESASILTSLGITDANDNGIADSDETAPSPFRGLPLVSGEASAYNGLTADTTGTIGTPDFVEAIMGITTTAPPNFTIRVDLDNNGTTDPDEMNTTISTTRVGPVQIKGFSTGFATGYEGGAITGKGIDFTIRGITGEDADADGILDAGEDRNGNGILDAGERNSKSTIQLVYRCIERSGGGCL